jgi:hypothetical protein
MYLSNLPSASRCRNHSLQDGLSHMFSLSSSSSVITDFAYRSVHFSVAPCMQSIFIVFQELFAPECASALFSFPSAGHEVRHRVGSPPGSLAPELRQCPH